MRKDRAIHDVVKTEHFGGDKPTLSGGAWLLGLASPILRKSAERITGLTR
jgi:hypothetical protein